jgi:Fe-S cluster assembly protein SufD
MDTRAHAGGVAGVNDSAAPFVDSMRDAAASLRLPGSDIAWLDHARQAAFAAFLERGLPDSRDETWKYTSLRALAQRGFAAGDATASTRPVASEVLPSAAMAGTRIVFVNGVFRSDLSELDRLHRGVALWPLSQALCEQPEPLRFLLAARAEAEDGFTLLNRALAADGVVLRVAAGVKVPAPLHVVHAGVAADAACAWHLRSLIEIGAGAGLDIVEHHLGEADAGHLANLVHEVVVRERARLGWTVVQTAGAGTTLLRRSDCRVGADALVDFHALELGGKLARHELRVELAGERAHFRSRGAFVLRDRQHADTEVLVTHRGRDTVSDSLWRGVADDRARGVAHGRILVLPGADGADGGFYNKNLLLSPGAEIDTRPALEIYADEVKANHGATVGQLDEHALFYLRSRGVPLDAARRMLVRAFCAATLDGIEPASLRQHCETLLSAQLPEAPA